MSRDVREIEEQRYTELRRFGTQGDGVSERRNAGTQEELRQELGQARTKVRRCTGTLLCRCTGTQVERGRERERQREGGREG